MHRKLKTALKLSLLALLMTGCTTTTSSSEFCLVAPGPLYLDDNEIVSNAHAEKLKEYDVYGINHCGWK